MIKAIKTYFKNKAIAGYCHNHKTQKQYRSDTAIKSMIIIFDGTQITKYGRINNIIKAFQAEGKNVTCLAYFDNKELDDICLTQHNIQFISRSDFKWNGLPDSQFISEFTNMQYNLCINLNLFYSDPVETLCKLCDAELKAGKDLGSKTVADLMIQTSDDKDETFLADQIKYYLRSVKSIER